MIKTPRLGPVMAMMLLAGANASLAAPTSGRGATTHGRPRGAVAELNGWDGRSLAPAGGGLAPAGITAVGAGDLGSVVAPPSWDDGAAGSDHFGADGARSAGDFAGASPLADISPDAQADALPLSQFSGTRAKPAPHGPVGVWDIVNRVRYGHLPEPASWALMLIGFGMIGAALRGFIVANRRLARLQPEDGE